MQSYTSFNQILLPMIVPGPSFVAKIAVFRQKEYPFPQGTGPAIGTATLSDIVRQPLLDVTSAVSDDPVGPDDKTIAAIDEGSFSER